MVLFNVRIAYAGNHVVGYVSLSDDIYCVCLKMEQERNKIRLYQLSKKIMYKPNNDHNKDVRHIDT